MKRGINLLDECSECCGGVDVGGECDGGDGGGGGLGSSGSDDWVVVVVVGVVVVMFVCVYVCL